MCCQALKAKQNSRSKSCIRINILNFNESHDSIWKSACNCLHNFSFLVTGFFRWRWFFFLQNICYVDRVMVIYKVNPFEPFQWILTHQLNGFHISHGTIASKLCAAIEIMDRTEYPEVTMWNIRLSFKIIIHQVMSTGPLTGILWFLRSQQITEKKLYSIWKGFSAVGALGQSQGRKKNVQFIFLLCH